MKGEGYHVFGALTFFNPVADGVENIFIFFHFFVS